MKTRKLKKAAIVLLSIALLLLSACGMSDEEIETLRQEQYDLGFEAGKQKGLSSGYAKGYREGKSAGHSEGYSDGWGNGYDIGHRDGWEECYDYVLELIDDYQNSGSYSTGSSQTESGYYIGNLNTHKFHRPSCSYLPAAYNQTYFYSRSAAINAGYSPCGHCNP